MTPIPAPKNAIEKSIFENLKIKHFFFVKKNSRSFRINLSDVFYVKAEGSSVVIKHSNGSDITYANLSSFERQIHYPYLVRVQRSYVVNLLNVTSFNDEHLFIQQNKTEHKIPIGRKFRKKVLGHFLHLRSD